MRGHLSRAEAVSLHVRPSSSKLGRYVLLALLMAGATGNSSIAQTVVAGAEEPGVAHKPDVFERLWKVYPNKADRIGAIEAWNSLKVSDEELFKMRTAYPRWKFSEEWTKEKGRHVPPLARWLNERMWEQEPPPQSPPTATEISSFLVQPLYLAPRLTYAITGSLMGGLIYPFNQEGASKVWNSALHAPWVWHEFVQGSGNE